MCFGAHFVEVEADVQLGHVKLEPKSSQTRRSGMAQTVYSSVIAVNGGVQSQMVVGISDHDVLQYIAELLNNGGLPDHSDHNSGVF